MSLVINLLKFKIMAVKFKVVKRKVLNGAEKDSVKNYAIAKTSGTSDLNKLCKLICSRSTLSSADVKAVLDSLNWAMDLELSSGNVVQLGEFGNFRMSINSEGTNTPEDFDATKIKGARIIFFPGSALLGASGIVFMMIVLSSFTEVKGGGIPVTLILVVILYLGGEISDGLFKSDHVSQLTHVVGGVVGIIFGFSLRGRRRR